MTRFPGLFFHVHPSTFILPQVRHRRQSLHARSPQELQQESLDLIVLVMGEDDVVTGLPEKDLVTGGTRGSLDAVARRNGYFHAPEGNAASAADAAAKSRPARRVRAQLMIHVQRGKTNAQVRLKPVENVEQHHRIDPAAQGGRDAVCRTHHPGEMRRDLLDQFLRLAAGRITAALP